MAVDAIDGDAGEWREEGRGDLPAKSNEPEEQRRVRQPVHEQLVAMRVIQVPISDTLWPLKNNL